MNSNAHVVRSCLVCSKVLPSTLRSDAIYCGKNCNKRHSRHKNSQRPLGIRKCIECHQILPSIKRRGAQFCDNKKCNLKNNRNSRKKTVHQYNVAGISNSNLEINQLLRLPDLFERRLRYRFWLTIARTKTNLSHLVLFKILISRNMIYRIRRQTL